MGLNLAPSNSTDAGGAFNSGVESTLGLADAPVLELRDRIYTALGYTFSWSAALKPGSGVVLNVATGAYDPIAAAQLAARVSDMQDTLRALYNELTPDMQFLGRDQVSAYESISAAFAQLYRDLTLSASSLPRPDLLDQVGDIGSAFFDAPAAAITALAEKASNGIARTLGGATAAIWSALWPWILIAGIVGVVYVFRAPLGRAVGKVAS